MRKLLSSALLIVAVSGCTAVSDFVKPYRIDVRQGNYITQDMVSQLKPGMSRDQVRLSASQKACFRCLEIATNRLCIQLLEICIPKQKDLLLYTDWIWLHPDL